ncbi:hypothetical protein [Chromobacterium haemolyticum]|uniref:hypothetical protein n=1 Tax=Chromobacterium haemolyticum TaxID=394935 RepID=UPI00244B4980|nr:hypothetical protein [Chromobacterium haemolyticum]MDH0342017.1 hypothetical protein [Chromobacterium haemolyticum]
MAANKRLKANELVMLLAGLLNLDVELMARVGNLPVRNLKSWLAGKKENLRPQSVINLMSLLGLKVDNGIRLDDSRVHYWSISDGAFTRSKAAYQPLTALSKLLVGCSITAVRPPKPSLADKRLRSYFLVSGNGVRVVVCVSKGFFKRARVNPEVIKGAGWRDDTDHHSIPTSNRLWTHLTERDLTTFEFDHIFNQTEENVSWNDVSLMAREFGVTAADAAQWIAEKFGDRSQQSPVSDEDDGGIDLDGSGKLLLLVGNNNRRAA